MPYLSAENLEGMWAGLPVPWTSRDTIDEPALRENVRRVCRVGLHGVYTHGTTGEFYAQSLAEWKLVAAATIDEAKRYGVPVQIGCTSLSTKDVVSRMTYAQKLGASAVQVAFPFWLPLTDDQALHFLMEVTSAVPGLPVVIYNTERSKKPLTVALLKRIVDSAVPVIGCKGVHDRRELKLFQKVAPHLRIFVGEAKLAGLWKYGARGCYSSLVYACPRLMLRYYKMCKQGDPAVKSIERKLKRLSAEYVLPRLERGMYDTAFDRTFATATGFLSGNLLLSRRPYDPATSTDVQEFREWCTRRFPEILQEA